MVRQKRRSLDTIRVRPLPGAPHRGVLLAGALAIPCAIGRTGTTHDKREGDGASPVGRFGLIQGFWRPDLRPRPASLLPMRGIGPRDGWCDDPADRRYNRPVSLPYPASAERMRREDRQYDIVIDLAANRGPILRGRGSAIFMHVARPGLAPTAGCVALPAAALARLLPRLSRRTRIAIG